MNWIGEPFKQNNKWIFYAYFKGNLATKRILLDWASVHFLSVGKYYTDGNFNNSDLSFFRNFRYFKFKHWRNDMDKLTTVLHDYNLALWTNRIRECRASGLTVSRWCDQNNIGTKNYYYWMRKIKWEAFDALSA